MITVAKATSAGYYTDGNGGMAPGQESYYLDAVTSGEPPGRWLGRGAARLGLEGTVEANDMHAVYGGFTDPRTGESIGSRPAQRRTLDERLADALESEPGALPERVAQIRRDLERTERKNVIGWDATFNVAKSVSVLHTAMHRGELAALRDGDRPRAEEFGQVRRGIESAVHEANDAAIAYLETLVTARAASGSGGPPRSVKADGIAVASFFQHTNRSIEPHLHVHNVLLNRVQCEDGEVRAVDGRDLLAQRYAPSAVADRVLTERLAHMGFASLDRSDGMGREMTVVPPEATEFFSGRRAQVTAAVGPILDAARERLGRDLTEVETYRFSRQATLATRASKGQDTESVEEKLDRWFADLVATSGRTLDSVAAAGLAASKAGPVAGQEWSPSSVLAEAVAACAIRSATWGKANLLSEIELRLPTLGLATTQVAPFLDQLAEQALASPHVVQVTGRDHQLGDDDYAAPSTCRYAAAGTLAAETALREAAVTRGRLAVPREAVDAWLDEHAPTIGADQRAAVTGLASSDAALAVLVGPAGTGKSFAAGALAGAWRDLTGGRVVGLAVSQIATQVLRDDGIPDAANITAWLGAQQRLSAGSTGEEDTLWQLSPSDVVMIDESSMVATHDLAAIRERVEAAGARMVLTGDPRQLAAVEAGGVLGLLDGHAETYHLADVRRFAAGWEREASLALRGGDRDALLDYDRHGRLTQHDGIDAAQDAAARAAVADRLDGRSVVVIAGTNAQAARIATAVRDQLVDLGLVQADGVPLGRDGCTASVGDLVACRRNDYALGVTNRAQYRVHGVLDDGGLVVEPLDGGPAQTLPAAYVADDVQLGYASTVHAAQGITVDAAHLVTDGGLDAPALYVAMSRGRLRNTAHVAVEPETPELPAASGRFGGQTRLQGDAPRATALSVLESCLERDGEALAATVAAEQDGAQARHMTTLAPRLESETRLACRARMETHLDDLVADGTLDPAVRARLTADQGSEYLSRALRAVEQAGTDPRTVLRDAVTGATTGRRSLTDAQSVAQVLSYRITGGRELPLPSPDAGLPTGIDAHHATRLQALADAVTDRRAELGAAVAAEAPAWAVLALGPVPTVEDPADEAAVADRADWEHRAGIAAAHREAVGWTDPEIPLGRMPGTSTTERRADYTTAWTALGRPDTRLEEAAMTDGQLLARLRAWQREQAWAPPHADDALRAAEQAAERARQDAALAEAAGRTDDAARLRADAEASATTAAGLADITHARASWAARTAVTQQLGEAARAELAERGIRPGAEADRITAAEYLAANHPDQADVQAEDDTRDVTDDDVAQVDTVDDLWAAELDEQSPDLALDQPEPVTASETPAHAVAPVGPSAAELDVLLAQASLAASVAADQASQDDAWRAEDERRTAQTATDAGRARREAAEAQTAADHPDAAAELASSAPEAAADPIAAVDAFTSAGESFESFDSLGADAWS